MSQILCYPVAWILQLRSICRPLQGRPPRRVVWHLVILLSSHVYKGHHASEPNT